MKIKLCGLSRRDDIYAVNRILPDYAGFVFAHGSKRCISYAAAASHRKLMDARIQAVGVFVNAQPDDILHLVRQDVIQAIQLHGGEDEDLVERLRREAGVPVIKAFGIRSVEDVLQAQETAADFCLLDTKKGDFFGGTGEAFDWSVIRGMKKPYFLAGGLNETNVLQAMRLSPYCLDISSGVETDGRKDAGKMERIVTMIRSEEHAERKIRDARRAVYTGNADECRN